MSASASFGAFANGIDRQSFIGKIISGQAVLRINILDDEACLIGHLYPVTRSVLADYELIQKLTNWRNLARRYFFTQFTATCERTRSWLKDVLLADECRLLFVINSNSKPVGHIGFRDLHDRTADLDNLIRGEIGGHPQLIYHAEIALIHWMFQNLEIDSVCAWVLAHNTVVSSLHKRVGFEPAEKVPLLQVQQEGTVILEKGDPEGVSPCGLYAQRIVLTHDRYRALIGVGGCSTSER
jgi:RimJ/RimL family protein N-acetyltransferase